MLPFAFKKNIEKSLNDEAERFYEALTLSPPVSIHFNLHKKAILPTNLEPVQWFSNAFYLPERPVFTLDPAFHGGAYYVQEASSMFLSHALKQSIDLDKPLKVLDLCAAPGGKSTLMMSHLNENSLIVCNEVIKTRVPVLKENLQKWGFPNVVVTNHDAADFEGLSNFFDVILVDAPCSGEGLFRKDKNAIQEWSEENVQLCAARQKRIVSTIEKCLAENGTLIYSTCTYNDSENFENCLWFEKEMGLEHFPLSIPKEWGIVEKERGYQFYPHKLKGEGFFLACFKKQDAFNSISKKVEKFKNLSPLSKKQVPMLNNWLKAPENFDYFTKATGEVIAIPKALLSQFIQLDYALQRKALGLELGIFKGNDFIPSHDLALSTAIHPDFPAIELDKETALKYLKKEEIPAPDTPEGWTLVRYEGYNLGWIKVLKSRINNYLPKEWRIRMEVEWSPFLQYPQ